jgi:hypothetical protein
MSVEHVNAPLQPDRIEPVMRMVEGLSQEIGYYRRRQVTTFRDAAIVLALITWGAYKLSGTEIPDTALSLHCPAGLACLAVGATGWWIIEALRVRIHHCRGKRNNLAELFQDNGIPCETIRDLFYPLGARIWGLELAHWPTSRIYGFSLAVLACFTSFANFLMGGCRPFGL